VALFDRLRSAHLVFFLPPSHKFFVERVTLDDHTAQPYPSLPCFLRSFSPFPLEYSDARNIWFFCWFMISGLVFTPKSTRSLIFVLFASVPLLSHVTPVVAVLRRAELIKVFESEESVPPFSFPNFPPPSISSRF